MATVELSNIHKRFPDGFHAIQDFSIAVADEEFLILVGPSGCGKSTALRMIAGLEDVTDGEILIGGENVVDVSPKDRDIAMVFQNYALYPNMSVYDNIGFSMRLVRVQKQKSGNAYTQWRRFWNWNRCYRKNPTICPVGNAGESSSCSVWWSDSRR